MQIIDHCWLPMPDGVQLSARLWLPEGSDIKPVPAVLEYIPYRKGDMVRTRDERNHAYFAKSGYAAVRVDMRGSGDSEGVKPDMYDDDELDDALSIIEWISKQSWCDGAVGMMGTSWGGTVSYLTAMRRPPALKAIIAVCATNNWYDDDIHHMGGCVLTDTVEWGATLPAILAAPPDPEIIGEGWREIWMQRLEALTFPLEHWITEETRSDYWKRGPLKDTPEALDIPVLAIAGWADRYSNTVMNVLAEGNKNIWGIIGPWRHQYPDLAEPGPGIGFQQEAVRWWDHWLKGKETGVEQEPRLRVWMQSYDTPSDRLELRSGRWVAEDGWPSPSISNRELFPVCDGKLSDAPSPSGLSNPVPYHLDVGKASGDTGYFGRVGGLPLDQRIDDEKSLLFETPPLEEAIEILGAPVLETSCRFGSRTAQLIVRLNDVSPEGPVARISYAVRNLALDELGQPIGRGNCDDNPTKLTLHNTAYRIEAGHRIRLSLSASYWPNVWPTAEDPHVEIVTAETRLLLPVRKPEQCEITPQFANPVIPPGSPNQMLLEAGELKRVAEVESASDRQSGWEQGFTKIMHNDIGLAFGFETKGAHSLLPENPLSAKSRFDHRFNFEREGWQVDVVSFAELTSDSHSYKMEGSVKVTENGVTIFEREWTPIAPRLWG